MIRGETITTAISDLPIPVADIANIYIIFRTNYKTLLEKTLADCEIDGELIECTISQEESLRLTCGPLIRSVIVVTKSGARFEHVNEVLVCGQTGKSEVLT